MSDISHSDDEMVVINNVSSSSQGDESPPATIHLKDPVESESGPDSKPLSPDASSDQPKDDKGTDMDLKNSGRDVHSQDKLETGEVQDSLNEQQSPSPSPSPSTSPSASPSSGQSNVPPPVPPKGQTFVLNGSGTEVYVTEQPARGIERIVILLTNSLGLKSENNMLLADKLAQRLECPIVMPDLFDKDPITVTGADMPPDFAEELISGKSTGKHNTSASTLSQVKAFAVNMVKGFMDEMWLAKHTFNRTYPRLAETVSELIQVYKPRKIGVVGYSFGGRYVLRLLQDDKHNEWSSDEYLVTVGASINPSLIETSDFDKVGKPLLMVYSAGDSVLDEAKVQAGLVTLKSNNVDVETNLIQGLEKDGDDDEAESARSKSDINLTSTTQCLPHGFAVPGDYPESVVGDRPEQVLKSVVSFISKHMTD